jgi:hypothetical protein
MRRLGLVIFIIMSVAAFSAAPSYSIERQMKVIHGEVSSVDWVGGILVVKWLEEEFDAYQEITFMVPDMFKINKGAGTIGLSELEIGDALIVHYYENPDGSTELISITDTAPLGGAY